jgi:hypothetical protein
MTTITRPPSMTYPMAPDPHVPQGVLQSQPGEPTNPYNTYNKDLSVVSVLGFTSGGITAQMLFNPPPTVLPGAPPATVKQIAMTAPILGGVISGVGFGVFSALQQMQGVINNKQDARGAIANVLADTTIGVAIGVGGSATGGLMGLGMKAIGATGGLGTFIAGSVGVVGGIAGLMLVEATGIRQGLLKLFGSQMNT